MTAPREDGWVELRREIEALPGPTNEPWGPVSRWSVLAIVDRLAAARGEPEIERLLEDGRKWRAAEAEGHIVTFSETGYGLQHPPSCRPDLINCPFNTYLAEQDEPGAPPGRYSMYGPLDGIEGPAYAVQP